MKKVLVSILVMVLAVALALPATTVGAAPDSMTVVSDTTTEVTAINGVPVGSTTYAAYAWEPGPSYPNDGPDDSAWEASSLWDNNLTGHTFSGSADWIWDSYRVVHPEDGDVVEFEKTFDIPGTPTAGTLHITCDNGYEVYLNGTLIGSAQVQDYDPGSGTIDWEDSDLTQNWVDTNNWQSVENYLDVSLDLQSGANSLVILTANEQLSGGTQSSNPGGLIFEMDIEYEVPSIEVEKHYSYTNVCFEKDNDLDGLFNEDPIDFDPITGLPIDNDLDGLFNEDPVDCPGGTELGDLLPMDGDDYVLEAVVHPKNNKVKSYNPGQYYAVSTVEVLVDVDKLTIFEDWSDCFEISALNPPKGGGSVVIVQVGPVGDVAYQILDATSVAVEVDIVNFTAKATIDNVLAGTTILMYVKFGPGLKGQDWNPPYECENFNMASVVETPTLPEDWIEATANLILIAKD